MINIRQFAFNPFQVNTYVLYDETKECIIIDAGNHFQKENERLSTFIESQKLKPLKLLSTHYHFDHILGNFYVKKTWPVTIAAHKAVDFSERFYNMKEQGRFFGMLVTSPPPIDEFLDEGDTVRFGNSELSVLHIPGHSVCSILFYCPEQKFIIGGDVLFQESIGRTDLEGGNYELLIKGIKEKLLVLPGDTEVRTGHGPKTTIEHERKFNPFLQH
jgi:glyoxylase-like metal-dependent hydrolase (beta-lactamase superfamily II)